jgi:peptide/nickel transport system substrate-binding protein
VGGLLRPGYELAASEEELTQYPGFSRDIEASRSRSQAAPGRGRAENLSFTFTNRNVPMPYVPVGIDLIDQWRQIGQVEHEQLETRAYLANLRGLNYDVGLDFNCDFMDEPNLQLAKYISAMSRRSTMPATTIPSWTSCTSSRTARLDPERRARDPARVRGAS